MDKSEIAENLADEIDTQRMIEIIREYEGKVDNHPLSDYVGDVLQKLDEAVEEVNNLVNAIRIHNES